MAFAVSAMMGSFGHVGHLPDFARGLQAVHLGHHDVHQDEVDARACLELPQRLPAVARDLDLGALGLEHAGQREDVPHVVLDDQDALALEDGLAVPRVLQHPLLVGGQLGFDLVQEERHLVEQPLRRAGALDDDRAASSLRSRCSSSA